MKNTANRHFTAPLRHSLSCECPAPHVMKYTDINLYDHGLPVKILKATWDEMACALSIELETKAGDKFTGTRRLEGRVEVEDLPGIITNVTNALLAAAGYPVCAYYSFFQRKWDIEEFHEKSPNLHVNPDMV